MTFARIITEWAEATAPGRLGVFDVISIGDSFHEREALFRVHKQHRIKFTPKSIKFCDRPSVDDLVRQHGHLVTKFRGVVDFVGTCDYVLDEGGFLVDHPPESDGSVESVGRSRSHSLATSSARRTCSPSARELPLISSRYTRMSPRAPSRRELVVMTS
jgi:hypothetical protein